MTRYEKFMESINTPEKLIEVFEDHNCFDELLGQGFCKADCKKDLSECAKCELEYLNREEN